MNGDVPFCSEQCTGTEQAAALAERLRALFVDRLPDQPKPDKPMRMWIRITQRPTVPYVDGIRVDCYRVGYHYEVDQTLGEIFLAEEWAQPVPPQALSKLPPPPVPLYRK